MAWASRRARKAAALPELSPSDGAGGLGVGDAVPISLYSSHRPRLRGPSGTVASTISTLLVLALLVGLISSPAASAFRNGFLNVHQMWVAFVGDPAKGILSVGKGFLLNLWLSVVCEAIVLVLALGVASLRLTTGPVLLPFRALAVAYTDFARGVPVILVMLWVGFGVPSLNIDRVSSQSPVVYAGFVLVFSYTAYVAEVYRAGLMSVPRSQVQAARSLGLSSRTTLGRVVLPQAVRNVLPALLNDFASLQKDTAIVSTLGVAEAVHAAQIAGGVEFNYSGFTIASLLFLAVTIPLTRYTDHIMARDRARRLAGSTA
jgi:polar amino acid transport system permease protein